MRRISNFPKFAIVRVVSSSFLLLFFFFFNIFFSFFFILLATDLPFTSWICRSRRVLITSSGTSLAPQCDFLPDRWVSKKAKRLVWVAAGKVARDGTKTAAAPGDCTSCVLERSFGGFAASWGYWRWETETAVCFLKCVGFFLLFR